MFDGFPAQRFSHGRIAGAVGVGEGIAVRRLGTANGGQIPLMQLEAIADIIQADAVSQLSVHQGNHMAVGIKVAGLFADAGISGELGDELGTPVSISLRLLDNAFSTLLVLCLDSLD